MIRIARTSIPGRHTFSPVTIRIEPNASGSHITWTVRGQGIDGVTGLHATAKDAVAIAAAVAARMIMGQPADPPVGGKPVLAASDGKKVRRSGPAR